MGISHWQCHTIKRPNGIQTRVIEKVNQANAKQIGIYGNLHKGTLRTGLNIFFFSFKICYSILSLGILGFRKFVRMAATGEYQYLQKPNSRSFELEFTRMFHRTTENCRAHSLSSAKITELEARRFVKTHFSLPCGQCLPRDWDAKALPVDKFDRERFPMRFQ